VDRVVEFAWVSEGLMQEMMGLEIMPAAFDVVQPASVSNRAPRLVRRRERGTLVVGR
jgi:hypothetical protein